MATGNEITCLSWDTQRERLALGNRERCIQVWTFDNLYKPHSIFSIQLSATVPKALSFAANGNVMAFGLYGGKMCVLTGLVNKVNDADTTCSITLRGSDGSIIGTQKVGGRMYESMLSSTYC